MKFFDTHCHLTDEKLQLQAPELAKIASQESVKGLCLIASTVESFTQVETLATQLSSQDASQTVIWTTGLHPHEAKDFSQTLASDIQARAERAFAIGETGLDYHYNFSEPDTQKASFDFHIELAAQTRKPLVIHCREAVADVLAMLDRPSLKNHPRPGILHCFTEDLPSAKRLIDLNFMISFSGILTFEKAQSLRDVAQQIPLDRILIETDSPFLAPKPFRGKNNSPALVRLVFNRLCEIRPESPEEIAATLWQNSLRVYGLH